MKKISTGAIVFLLVLIGMFLTKPSSEDFDRYIDKKYSRNKNDAKTELQNIINSGINKTLAFEIKQTKEYHDYRLFATVDALEVDKEVKFLGALGLWFPVL